MDRLNRIVQALKEVSENLKIHPSEVTKAMVLKNTGEYKVTEWDLKQMVGGLGAIKRAHFPIIGEDLLVIRQVQDTNKYIKSMEKQLAELQLLDHNMKKVIEDSVKSLKVKKVTFPKIKASSGTKMTMELMLSDIHYGKKTDNFDLATCRLRMKKLATVFLEEVKRKEKAGYKVERFILALLGDIIESYTMHGLESAASCEFGNSKQVQSSIESLFHDIILPLAKTGVKIDIPAITGNHDRTEKSRTMNNPGLNNLTWIIYNTLRELCSASGLKNVKFYIPENSYQILSIYDNNCLYEHGDNSKSNNKRGFEMLMEKRSRQLDIPIHFGRFGHFHEYAVFDRGRIIVNESVCGQDSYAEVLGFSSSAGQTINFYVDTNSRPNCFYYSFPVYLG